MCYIYIFLFHVPLKLLWWWLIYKRFSLFMFTCLALRYSKCVRSFSKAPPPGNQRAIPIVRPLHALFWTSAQSAPENRRSCHRRALQVRVRRKEASWEGDLFNGFKWEMVTTGCCLWPGVAGWKMFGQGYTLVTTLSHQDWTHIPLRERR